jgi:hypothetical protein
MKPYPSRNPKLTLAIPFTAAAFLATTASAQVLATENFSISSGAGGSGAAATSCMIMSDGTSWSGGAVGVQGASGLNDIGGSSLAANDTFKFGVGSTVSSLNATYGAGDWTIANPELTFQYTLYANNSRFNAGAGGFNIYWVANDSWVQGSVNPVYATTAAGLSAWSGGQALIGSEYYNWSTPGYTGTDADEGTSKWITDKTGIQQATISYDLILDPSFVNDITSATASSDPNVSLYLMATSPTTGLTIFTGGASVLPTLTFEVVAIPEPSAWAMAACGLAGLASICRWKTRK